MRPLLVLAAALAATVPAAPAGAQDALIVFAAASTSEAMADAAAAFAAEVDGARVVASFAASSTLARQIDHGAPAEVFVSASTEWMDWLEVRSGIVPTARFDVARNRLVLVAPEDSALDLAIAPGFPLAAALAGGRLAVGDPDHVPAGIYARRALESLGVWNDVEPLLARAGDVRAALALVERGEAAAGIVYATDAAAARVRVVGTFADDSHGPLVLTAALTSGARHEFAATFVAFLASAGGQAAFARHGFAAPDR